MFEVSMNVMRILLATFALAVAAAGCNSRDKYEVYMEGLQLEATAAKGPCRLHTEAGQPAPVLSGDQVMTCLRRTEEAIVLYEEAGKLGMKGADYDRVLKKAHESRDRLKAMLTNVRAMERGQM